ncbi:MAG: hypothetical protein Q9199_000330 [Rusavskia elegans]
MYLALLSLLPLLAAAGPLEKRQGPSFTPNAPSDFCGAVFNTDACRKSDSLVLYLLEVALTKLVGFSLQPFSQKNNYDTTSPPGPCVEPEGFDAARLPLIMDPADTNNAIEWLKSDHPPPYLGLFNEPDFSFGGWTPVTLPEASAKNLTTLIDAKTSSTKLLSPVPAYPFPEWLDQFDGNCTGCMDKIDIISAHIYHVKPEDSIAQIEAIHERWQKPIWVTEMAPTTEVGKCQYTADEMSNYMTTVVNAIKKLDYVEKIFWNGGAYGFLGPGYENICNPSLTNEDGSPTALLDTYKGLCSA